MKAIIQYVISFTLLNLVVCPLGAMEKDKPVENAAPKIASNVTGLKPGALGGVVFNTRDSDTVYHVFSYEKPLELACALDSAHPSAHVFANRGGIVVSNPDVNGIISLTLAAAKLVQKTATINQGSVVIKNTHISPQEGLSHLWLLGKTVVIDDSVIEPRSTIRIVAGSHTRSLDAHSDYLVQHPQSNAPKTAISLNKNTILSSQDLLIESFESGAVVSKGLLQSSAGDIIIRAKGDVDLAKVSCQGNLFINASGTIHIQEGLIGGALYINGNKVIIDQCSVQRASELHAHESLELREIFTAEEYVYISSEKILNLAGFVATVGNLCVVTKGTIKQSGTLKSRKALVIQANDVIVEGTMLADEELSLALEGQCATTKEAVIVAPTIRLVSKAGKMSNAGELFSNNCFMKFSQFDNVGKIRAKQHCIVHFDKFINNGSSIINGEGCGGYIGNFENNGEFETESSTLKCITLTNNGKFHTKNHLSIKAESLSNTKNGTFFTLGVHSIELRGNYVDSGSVYTPTLFMVKAFQIDLMGNMHATKVWLSSRDRIFFKLGSHTTLYETRTPIALKIISPKDIFFLGDLRQSHASFPLLDYYSLTHHPQNITAEDIQKQIDGFKWKPWESLLASVKDHEISFTAGGNIHSNGEASTQLGALKSSAGKKNSVQGTCRFGGFDANVVIGDQVVLRDAVLGSVFNQLHISGRDLSLQDGHLAAPFTSVEVQRNVDINNGSSDGSLAIKGEKATIQGSLVAKDFLSFLVNQWIINSNASVRAGEIKGTADELINDGSLTAEGMLQLFVGRFLNRGATSSGASTHIVGDDLSNFGSMTSQDQLNLLVKHLINHGSTFSEGMTTVEGETAENFGVIGSHDKVRIYVDHFINGGNVDAQKIHAKAKVMEQYKKLKAKEELVILADTLRDSTGATYEGDKVSFEVDQETLRGDIKAQLASLKFSKMQFPHLLALLAGKQLESVASTEAHLQGDVIVEEDWAIKNALHIWARRLENKKKITAASNFSAHMQDDIMNHGIMNVSGTGVFVAGGTFTNEGDVSTGEDLYVKAKEIKANAQVTVHEERSNPHPAVEVTKRIATVRIPTFKSGKSMMLESEGGIEARAASFQSVLDTVLKAKGKIDLTGVDHDENDVTIRARFFGHDLKLNSDPLHKYTPATVSTGGNFIVKTPDTFVAPGIQAISGGSITIQADKGIDTRAVARVSVTKRWDYRTGIFGQNEHKGWEETAEFTQGNFVSKNGTILMQASNGEINVAGNKFFAEKDIVLDAPISHIGSVKAVTRSYSSDDDKFLCFGSTTEKNGTKEDARVVQMQANKAILATGAVSGDAARLVAPQIKAKRLDITPLELKMEQLVHRQSLMPYVGVGSVGVKYSSQAQNAVLTQQFAGLVKANKLILDEGGSFVPDMDGLTPQGMDIETGGDIVFKGLKNTYTVDSNAWSVNLGVNFTTAYPTPEGGFTVDIAHRGSATHQATAQNIRDFHATKDMQLKVEGGAQTSIQQTSGAAVKVTVDGNAEDTEEQSGFGLGAQISASNWGGNVSASGGEKRAADTLTVVRIAVPHQSTQVETKNYDTKDDRWGFGIGYGGGSVAVNFQVQDLQGGFTVPTSTENIDYLKLMADNVAMNSVEFQRMYSIAQKAQAAYQQLNAVASALDGDNQSVDEDRDGALGQQEDTTARPVERESQAPAPSIDESEGSAVDRAPAFAKAPKREGPMTEKEFAASDAIEPDETFNEGIEFLATGGLGMVGAGARKVGSKIAQKIGTKVARDVEAQGAKKVVQEASHHAHMPHKAAEPNPANRAQFLELNKKYARDQAKHGPREVIAAGEGHPRKIDDIERLVETHRVSPGQTQKTKTREDYTHTTSDGESFDRHDYRYNDKVLEVKVKIPDRKVGDKTKKDKLSKWATEDTFNEKQ